MKGFNEIKLGFKESLVGLFMYGFVPFVLIGTVVGVKVLSLEAIGASLVFGAIFGIGGGYLSTLDDFWGKPYGMAMLVMIGVLPLCMAVITSVHFSDGSLNSIFGSFCLSWEAVAFMMCAVLYLDASRGYKTASI